MTVIAATIGTYMLFSLVFTPLFTWAFFRSERNHGAATEGEGKVLKFFADTPQSSGGDSAESRQ
ncbi:hypothetical protein ACRQ5Q_42515 (plasmid) [Bradyrhizobium sp. PMVTL-01]|uniref:hypothetical protein n=1 Tax=Bradyrhizobium sp. PMVTL-01 TaxID=3434999 RepID=UPI003F714193